MGVVPGTSVSEDQTRHHQKTAGKSDGKAAKLGYCAMDDARVETQGGKYSKEHTQGWPASEIPMELQDLTPAMHAQQHQASCNSDCDRIATKDNQGG